MNTRKTIAVLCAALLAASTPLPVHAQEPTYPTDSDDYKAMLSEYPEYYRIQGDSVYFLEHSLMGETDFVISSESRSAVEYADFVTTTTHKTLRGPRGGVILCKEQFAKQIDKAMFPGLQGGPLMHIIAGKAVCFKEALEPEFVEYQKQVVKNAQVLAEELIKYDFELVSGGTDNHLLLVKLVNKGLTGKVAEKLLDEAGITTNKNSIPNDPNGPFVTSGIRLGTPAMTTRGFKEDDVRKTAEAIALVINNPEDEEAKAKAKAIVKELCEKHPLHK